MTDSQIETIKQIARLNYGYELTSEAAGYVATLANTISAGARGLAALNLGGVEPPFGLTTLMQEAARMNDRRK
jgi:hypothetical protein